MALYIQPLAEITGNIPMLFLGLDIGTTGAKAIIMNSSGLVMGQCYQEYPTESPKPDLYELDPDRVWEAVKTIIKKSISSMKSTEDQIAGIAVSSLGESVVFLDQAGEVTGNSLLYLDHRGNKQLDRLVEDVGAEVITAKTGHNPHAMYTLPKLMWHKEENGRVFENAKLMLPFGSFVLHRLGARPVMDYSLASRTLAFNTWDLKWDEALIKASGIKRSLFPEVAPVGTIIGEVQGSVAAELGLPIGTKLVLGAQDQVCAAIGAGIKREGMAAYGMGTVHCMTPVFSPDVRVEKMKQHHFPIVPYLPGKYTTYAFSFTGGSILKWFRDELGELEQLHAEKQNRNVYEILDELASKEPTELLVLPHFAGSGTPYMDPDSKGGIIGVGFKTTKGEIYRALMEGVAYEMKLNIDCLENSEILIDEIRACGGGAMSDLWIQITADVLNKKIVDLDINEAGILGAIFLAAVALGEFESLEAAADQLIKINKVYQPRVEYVEHYQAGYRKYKKMYTAVKGVLNG